MNKKKIRTIIVTREGLLPFLLLQKHLCLEFQKRTHIFRIKLFGKRQKKRNLRGNLYRARNMHGVTPLVINLFEAGVACRLVMNVIHDN